PRKLPLTPYLLQVALFYFISLLNNAAFGYRIPMTVHIIFRSGGLIISMLLGWLIAGKRYTTVQVFSVLLVTLGVMLTTLSASPTHSSQSNLSTDPYIYTTGITILTLALIFSGLLGLVQDWTYSKYGRPPPPGSAASNGSKDSQKAKEPPAWQESMFYLHFLGLPMFFSVRSDLIAQIHAINAGPQMPIPFPFSLEKLVGLTIPAAALPLLLNTLTQLFCVAGVHRLTTRVNSLTVTLVLVVRKAVSLVLSVVGFGLIRRGKGSNSDVDMVMMWFGAAMVLVGTMTYSIGSKRADANDVKKKN
ncbi:UDP-xylose and UDP-N-acetylglucosamine transporter, partial [Termitomyces sp. J132]